MNVSAIVVTRGNVDILPVLESLPKEWERLIWVNSNYVIVYPPRCLYGEGYERFIDCDDLSVYGRYAAIQHATHDLVYVQDDDCIVSDPQAIVDAWVQPAEALGADAHVVCNMPERFRHDFYTDNGLVGFGAAFHRDAPTRAFERYWAGRDEWLNHPLAGWRVPDDPRREMFLRTCDIVFTGLTPRVLVDVPYEDREFASDPDRMWRQPEHVGERSRMRELVRQVAAQ